MRRPLASLCLAALAIHALPARGDQIVGPTREIPDGNLDYTPAVPDVSTSSGQYAPRIALELPMGPGGMTPDLSVVYAAGRNTGPLGAGWSLAFESTIARKSALGGLPTMTATDTFWLDGQKLIAMSDGTYRTEHDDFVVYRKVTGTAGTIVAWTGTKDGKVTTYGLEAGNEVEYRDETVTGGIASGSKPVAWRLASQRNPFGATISYRYAVPTVTNLGRTSRRHQIDTIIYAAGVSGSTEITFGYEPRPDVRVSYANGPERIDAKRLRRIVVKRTGATVATTHYYLFLYRDGTHSPESLLTEVKRVAVADPATPPTPGNEASLPSVSLGRFEYSDAATTWGTRSALALIGDPPLEISASKLYYTMSLLADVDADARPDLVVFNDECHMESVGGLPDPGDEDLPNPSVLMCEPDHRVYINTIQENRIAKVPAARIAGTVHPDEVVALRNNVFVYNATRSQQVTDFFGPIHGQAGTVPVSIVDLGRDGYADLIKPARLSTGDADGWDTNGVAANWSTDTLENNTFADVDGDGYPDLVGQDAFLLNTGSSPYIPSGLGTAIVDPVVAGHASSLYDSARSDCLDGGDTGIILRFDYPVPDQVHPNDPDDPTVITADEWVWRNTINADFNGDGLLDRLISVPFLRQEDPLESPGGLDLWVRDDATCGVHDELYLGNGRGQFTAAGYGIGGPMSREAFVQQVRTIDNGPGQLDVTTYAYHANHFALADVDADGRNDVTQFCDGDTRFVAMADQGIGTWQGRGPGYQIDYDSGASCPTGFTASVPEQFFGLSMLDYHYSTTADIDGDGMVDLFQYSHPYGDPDEVVTNDDTPWEDWSDGPSWRRNQRATAQNRLSAIITPRGGRTEVTWAWSAQDPGNHFATNVEHIESVTNAQGRTVYSFEGGAYDHGEFMGFGRVETLMPRGATLVETFTTARALRGSPSTEELYDSGGRLKNLRVSLYGSEDPTMVPFGGGFGWDGWAPFYNPLLRRCEFEFGYLGGIAPLSTDIDSYIAKCEAFDDEPGILIGGVLDHRSLYGVLRGADPLALAKTPAERKELVTFRDLLNGKNPAGICTPLPGTDGFVQPGVCRRFTTTPKDTASASVYGADSGPTTTVTFSAAPYRTRFDLSFAATTLSSWVLHGIVLTQSRMFVNEYSYNNLIGHVIEHRELRDTTTTADSLVHTYDYAAWDPTIDGAPMIRERTKDRGLRTFEDVEYSNFQNGAWKTRTEHDTASAATRLQKRTFTALGDVATVTNGANETTTYTFSPCGPQTDAQAPLGYRRTVTLDAACRVETLDERFKTATIAQTTYTRDGYGRTTSEIVNPSFGSTAMPTVTRRFAYDDTSGPASSSAVVIEPEPDGSTTLAKTYVDVWGRAVRTVRCAAGGGGGTGLDATYGCDADTEVATETVYDAATGDAVATVGPYLSADVLRPTTSAIYDEFGRRVVTIDPYNRSTTIDYGLGRRSVVDPLARRTEVTFDTLTQATTIDGVFQGSTTRDAFGRTTNQIDAAGNQTDFYYDGYNRKRQELSPSVPVLASGAASPANQRLSTSFTYDLADRLQSRTDPANRVTSYTYDAAGRIKTVTGPDGNGDGAADLVESRTYVDGDIKVRKVIVTDGRLGVNREEYLDGLGRIWKQVAFDGTVTQTKFDSRGRAFQVTMPWGEVRTTEVHDGGLTSVSTVTQRNIVATTTTTFDATGQPLVVTDPDGQVLTHEYDLAGRLVTKWQGSREVEHRTYDYAGRPSEVRINGATTCYTYDALDRVTLEESGCVSGGFIVNPGSGRGLVNRLRTYTATGQLDTETDGAGAITNHDYDAVGRHTATEVFAANGTSVGRRTFDYDATGNQTRATDELGFVTRTAYDVLDRVTSVDPANGDPVQTSYAVDAGSWVITTTSPTGEVASRRNDAMGRTWRTCGADGTCIDQLYTNGLLTSRARRDAAGAIFATQYLTYYPSSPRVASEWDWLGAGEVAACGGAVPTGCTIPHLERTWTVGGRPATVVDAQGNVTSYGYATDGSAVLSTVTQTGMPDITIAYDASYPLVTRRTFHPATGPDVTETTTYERNLRVDRIDRALNLLHEVTTFDYDGAGRVTLNQLARGTETVAMTDAYDARGELATRSYAIATTAGNYNGALIYTRRNNGQLSSVTYPSKRVVNYNYDATTARLTSIASGADLVFEAVAPDASGRAATLRYDNNALRVVRRFDTAGRPAGRDVFGTTANKRTETYGYDTAGRLARIDVAFGVTTGVSLFGYNDRDRLTSESHTLGAQSQSLVYTYDPTTGVRLAKDVTTNGSLVTTTYGYEAGNRLVTVDAATLAWDGFGRQTSDAAARTFQYGLTDQLMAIEEAGVVVESNWFTAAGQRIVRTTPTGGTEYFLPGANNQIVERIAGSEATDYVATPGGAVVGTIDATGVTGIVDSITGSPYRIGERSVDHLYVDTTAFGEPINVDGVHDEPRGFHGMFTSAADEIKIAGVRAYDTTTGRFLTADPLGLAASPEAIDATDPYRYAQDNPVGLADPTGFAPMPTGKLQDPCLMTLEGGCRPRDPTYEEQRAAAGQAWLAEQQERAYREAHLIVIRIPYSDGHGAMYLMAFTPDAGDAEATQSTANRSPGTLEQTSEPVDASGAGMGGGSRREAKRDGGRHADLEEPNMNPDDVVRRAEGGRRWSEEVTVIGKRPLGARILDGLQLALDVAGLIDPVGPLFDLANAGISGARGDKLGAAMSMASAFPFVGTFSTGAKFAKKLVALSAESAEGARNVKRLYGMMGMGAEALKRGEDGREIVVTFRTLDEVRRAQKYNKEILGVVDPILEGSNVNVINGALGERWLEKRLLDEGSRVFPSQIGRNGLDAVWSEAGNLRYLDVADVKVSRSFELGDGFSKDLLSYNKTLRTWQGTSDYILGQTQLLMRNSDPALRYTGDMLNGADAIRSSLWVMDRYGNFAQFELGIMYRFDDVWHVVEEIPGSMMR